MSLFQDENDFIIGNVNNIELDDKVKIEETLVNLDCVKKEEPDFEGIDYVNPFEVKIKFDDVFEEKSKVNLENAGCLKSVMDENVRFEEEVIKLENIKDEEVDSIISVKHFSCDKCAGNYDGFCLNCSSLSHILSTIVILDLNIELDLNTIPKNILEIREVSNHKGVFALKPLQKGVIFGPFEGVSAVECTSGLVWKIKEWKFVTQGSVNWMKHVSCAANRFRKNMDIFQMDGDIYFQTSRKIKEGEELLIHYSDEVMLGLDNGEECYFVPEEKKDLPKIFACCECNLGFCLESCLVEHKNKCPFVNRSGSNNDFEITECSSCKIWLEKQEYQGSHMSHCLKNYQRFSRNFPDFQRGITEEVGNTLNNEDAIRCSFYGIGGETATEEQFCGRRIGDLYSNVNEKDLEIHLSKYSGVEPFLQCDICEKKFSLKRNLKQHIKIQHLNTNGKQYRCFQCSYQTNYKCNLKAHLNTHTDNKPFECDVCKQKFINKITLRCHKKNKHTNTCEKKYKCPECSYQTNYKNSLQNHLNTHSDVKPFQCGICKKTFAQKSSLKQHGKEKHSNSQEREYKCRECSYQTNRKSSFTQHLNTHNDVKKFQCNTCERKFKRKFDLKSHIGNVHSSSKKEKILQIFEGYFKNKY